MFRVKPKIKKINFSGEEVENEFEEEDINNLSNFIFNLRWVTGLDSGTERRNLETEWEVHEGSEEEDGRIEEVENWGRAKTKGYDFSGKETSTCWLMIFTMTFILSIVFGDFWLISKIDWIHLIFRIFSLYFYQEMIFQKREI